MALASVDAKGPLFDGQAVAAAARFSQALQEHLAKKGQEGIRRASYHMNKTGRSHFTAHEYVRVDNGPRESLITGPLIDYVVSWPWLEGTSKRNVKSKFKGYHAFRLETQRLRAEADLLAEEILPPYLKEMGG